MWKVAHPVLLLILGVDFITELSCLEVSHFRPDHDHAHNHAHDYAHSNTGSGDLQWYTEVGPDGVAREVQLTRAEIDRRLRELQAKGITDTRYYGSSGLLVPDGPPRIDQLRPGDVIPGTGNPWVTAAIEEEKRRVEMERLKKEKLEQERRIKELEKKLALEKKKKEEAAKKNKRPGRPGRRNPGRGWGRRPTNRATPASVNRPPPPPPPRPTQKPRSFLQRLIAKGRETIDRFRSNAQSRPRLRGAIFLG